MILYAFPKFVPNYFNILIMGLPVWLRHVIYGLNYLKNK